MAKPHLFTNPEAIARIKANIKKYEWYKKSFYNIQSMCDVMLEKGFEVPTQKGYVFNETCRAHNAALLFDPYNRELYICPVCKVNYKDEPYKRAWITTYHAWLSQMSIYLGICFFATEDAKYAKAIKKILDGYIKYYPTYPNEDNEIGTAKVFQSTFMDSVWLSYLCAGYDMVNDCDVFSDEDRKASLSLFLDVAKVIRDYDEKWNNRQAFNNSGMCAAAFLSEDKELLDYVLNGEHGFIAQMGHSILEDGLWYEGDNYHFATVPSMVNIAEMCYFNGIDLYNKSFSGHSIKDMFYAPLKSLLPDGTFPSRKDSPYANSMINRWYCGLYELAYARYKDKELADFLNLVYASVPDKSMALSSAAGIMDILKPAYASKEEMDWRAFLSVQPRENSDKGLPVTTSINMTGTGLAVLRRKNSYINLDYGNYGGGHGHPDRLNITCFLNNRRWFTDYGTGNYYLDHLRYYRSTLGHNTVNQDGKRKSAVSGEYDLFYSGRMFDAASGKVADIYPKTFGRRTVVLFDNGIAFDYINIKSDESHTYHNVYHSFGKLNDESYHNTNEIFEEEGYDFLHDIKRNVVKDGQVNIFETDKASLIMHGAVLGTMVQYSARAYGPPKNIPDLFPILIQEKTGEEVFFANIYEDVKSGQKNRIKSLTTIDSHRFEICFNDDKKMIIDVSQGVEIIYDGIEEKAIYENKPEIDTDITYECWIDFKATNNKLFCVAMRNNNSYEKKGDLFDKDIVLDAFGYEVFRFPITQKGIVIEDGYLKAYYSKNRKPFIKKIICTFEYDRSMPINEAVLQKNIFINDISAISRAERKWKGEEDLSASGSIFVSSGRSLSIVLNVKDDKVLFSGGKYEYDNDNIQLYFNKRKEEFRNVDVLTDEVYSLMLKGGSSGNVSKAIAMTKCVKDINGISLSISNTDCGYDVCVDIPFHCLGGKPSKGDIWGFDLTISDRDSGVRRELIAYWSGALPNERTYMCGEDDHDPRRFGLLMF